MNEINSYKVENLKTLIRDAYWASEKCHKTLFPDQDDIPNEEKLELIAAHYLNKAISFMSAAKAVYISSYDVLERQEVEDIFAEFNSFESEFLECLEDNHSHQWTDIHFNKLKASVELLIDSL